MRQYNHLTAIPLSFFSRKLYRDVAANWHGIGFWYLFLIMLISYLAYSAKAYFALRSAATDIPSMAAYVPPVTITNGVVSSPATQPYIVSDPHTNQPIAILDTTGVYTNLDSTPAKFLVTDHKVYTRGGANDVREYDLSGVKSFYVDNVKAQEWLGTLFNLLPVALLVFGMIGSMILWLIAMLIWGGIGQAMASGSQRKLTYAQCLRLSAVAMTVPLAVETLAAWSPISSGCLTWLVLQGLGLLMLWFAIKSQDIQPISNSWPGGGFAVGPPPPPPG